MRLWRCCYLCLVGLRPVPQPFRLSPPRMVRPHTHGACMGQGARVWLQVVGCRWSNGLTTGGESVGWRLQAGDESLQWTIRCLDNTNRGSSMLDHPSGGQSASGHNNHTPKNRLLHYLYDGILCCLQLRRVLCTYKLVQTLDANEKAFLKGLQPCKAPLRKEKCG